MLTLSVTTSVTVKPSSVKRTTTVVRRYGATADDEYANDPITDDDKPGIPEPVDPAEAEEDEAPS